MGLLADLGYEMKPPNAFQRSIQNLASTRPVAWVFQKTLYPLDKTLYRLTDGRVTAPGLLAGLPVIMLTTTGVKSGKSRTMPLLGIPMGNSLVIIGTNYGQKPTPGWVYNLKAEPAAMVGYRDRTIAVTARPANEAETKEAFDLAVKVYPAFNDYRTRANHREISAFVLATRT